MATRTLYINILSAEDLQDANLLSKMDVYAVATLLGHPGSKQKVTTSVARGGGTNPSWNFPARFTIDSRAAKQNGLIIEVKIRCSRVVGDKDIGEVIIPVKELLDSGNGNGQSLQYVSYQVRKPSGRAKGELNISYKFGEPAVAAVAGAAPPPKAEPAVANPSASFPTPPPKAEPATAGCASAPFPAPQPSKAEPFLAYPAQVFGGSSVPNSSPYHTPPPVGYSYQATSTTYAYPPPPPYPHGYGVYPPPPVPGYGYPAPPAYGYPQVQQPPKNKFGLGLGAGLLGGALGGLLLGDMVSDAASYDAGYDAGFGDGGGFGF